MTLTLTKKLFTFVVAAVITLSAGQAYAESTPTQYVMTNQGWVTVFKYPSTSKGNIGRLQLRQKAPIISKYNRYWYKINFNGQIGYITTSTKYITTTPAPAPVPEPTPAPAPVPHPQPTLTEQQQRLVEVGKTQLGVDWKHGTQIPGYGFDCSNFTSWVYKQIGIKFSSSSRTQRYNDSIGRPVPVPANNKFANLQVGDLLFFANSADAGGGGHVGIYAGEINGKHYVLQSGGGRGKVTYEPMEGTWFAKKLVYAKRIL